jgi:hypothetical protein
MDYTKLEWPPYTCVATYVYECLKRFGIKTEPRIVAQSLKIKIPTNCRNPLGLVVTEDSNSWGIQTKDVVPLINNLLIQLNSDLQFRHIPLNVIPYQMYEEVLDEFFKKSVLVGVGFDFSDVDGSAFSNKHVSLVIRKDNKYLIEDYYEDSNGKILPINFREIIRSAQTIHDGYWLIGKKDTIFTTII